jgi:hypothetical protein
MGHTYSIDFDHIRTESEKGTKLPSTIHHFGRLEVYSHQEIPTERLLGIVDEVKRALPKGLTIDKFEETVYRVLEEKNLRRFERVINHGSIGKIEYEQGKTLV